MRLKFENLEKLTSSSTKKLLSDVTRTLNLDSIGEARKILFTKLQEYEANYQMTSEDMFSSADCEKRELDSELDNWATLYMCYKELAC